MAISHDLVNKTSYKTIVLPIFSTKD
ncbi:hypothetical protein [Macrococcus brunensis]|nr:hypothetical protein [Macrococcus brunensis]ULG73077.1 hypothetical protein MGG12_06215 [Macrococcus brunensis]ULG75256.1 hypothetical protein MGG13_06065 [Macrococcus brunensis]